MNNINKLNPQTAIVFNNGTENLVLIKGKTVVMVITDGSNDFEKECSGLVTDINEDFIEIENGDMIDWEYIRTIEIQ